MAVRKLEKTKSYEKYYFFQNLQLVKNSTYIGVQF